MTSLNQGLSLEDVLDQFFYTAEQPSPDMVLQACKAYPEYRLDILEFAALWVAYEATAENTAEISTEDVSEESVSRLQSFVLNRLHELEQQPSHESDIEAASRAISDLAGGRLRRAAAATELGTSSILLQKILTNSILDVPSKILNNLANHLNVSVEALQKVLGPKLAGGQSYKSKNKPNLPTSETWESAVRSLPIAEEEKSRLLSLQDKRGTL